jgi:hypothetical protein
MPGSRFARANTILGRSLAIYKGIVKAKLCRVVKQAKLVLDFKCHFFGVFDDFSSDSSHCRRSVSK